MSEVKIPEDLEVLYDAIQSFAKHSPSVCECDLEGGDEDCKIEPKRLTPHEWEKMSSHSQTQALIERIATQAATIAALTSELETLRQRMGHELRRGVK